jgi:hypothetical protein
MMAFRAGGGKYEYRGRRVSVPLLAYSDRDHADPVLSVRERNFFFETDTKSVEDLRARTLGAFDEFEPELRKTLRGKPFQTACKIQESHFRSRTWFRSWDLIASQEQYEALRIDVTKWSEQWHLSDKWCLEWALHTLSWWSHQPESEGWFHASLIEPFRQSDLAPPFEKYDVTRYSRTDYERINAEDRKRYCDWIEKQAKDGGLVKTREKRNEDHFNWLAQLQIGGRSCAAIWRGLTDYRVESRKGRAKRAGEKGMEDKISRDAVEMAIHRLAKQIGLTLRTDLENI